MRNIQLHSNSIKNIPLVATLVRGLSALVQELAIADICAKMAKRVWTISQTRNYATKQKLCCCITLFPECIHSSSMGTQTRIHVKTTKKNNKNKDGVQVQVESSISFPKVAATMMYPSLYWYLVNVRPLASTSTAM